MFKNAQGRPLQIRNVLITGHAPSAFRVRQPEATVQPGATFPIQVSFTPEVKGARFANLTLQFADGSSAGPAQLSGYGR
jgi:hypothetical protein